MSTTEASKLALGTGVRNDNLHDQLIALAEYEGQPQGDNRINPESRALAVAEVLDEALAALENTTSTFPAPSSPRTSHFDGAFELSPREREVLALVAEGRSNKAIADELFVSPNTVKTHVASLLHKLHADTRVQLATLAARQGLS